MKKNDLILIITVLAVLAASVPLILLSRAPKDAPDDRFAELSASDIPSDSDVSDSDVSATDADAGPVFVEADKSYFDDALFIGDSRTDELRTYGTLDNADYFSATGTTVYKIFEDRIKVKDVGSVTLDELLTKKKYGKIYVMLGFNEIGYNRNKTIKKYGEVLDRISSAQPDAVIYVMTNLLVSQIHDSKSKYEKSADIIELNRMITEMAEERGFCCLDVNPLFCDDGFLRAELTGDGVHLYAKYSKDWCDWLCEHTVER